MPLHSWARRTCRQYFVGMPISRPKGLFQYFRAVSAINLALILSPSPHKTIFDSSLYFSPTTATAATGTMSFYDEIEIEDMTYHEATTLYTYPCPCGDQFEISLCDLRDGEEVAVCPSCSLTIKVIFEAVSIYQLDVSEGLMELNHAQGQPA